MLEGGYTFNSDGASFSSHSYPEALLRIGAFTNWFEFRLGQGFLNEHRSDQGIPRSRSGAEDLYLGFKVAGTGQKGYLPEFVIIPQITIPTGNSAVTPGKTLPGVNVDLTWELIENRTASNRLSERTEFLTVADKRIWNYLPV